MPRWPEKNSTDTLELDTTLNKEVILPASGSIRKELDELGVIEVHDKPLSSDAAASMAFAEEKVTVMVHEDASPNAENPIQVTCNGVNQFFIRGQAQDVKRKYLEILARCRRTGISTPEVNDGFGARTSAIRKASSLRYPFQVIYDPNPKGPAWLKAIMQEGY